MSDKLVTDIMVNYAGHAFRTYYAFWACHVTTSTNRVGLKAKRLQECFCFMRQI